MGYFRWVMVTSTAVAALMLVAASVGRAEMQILETNVSKYAVGEIVPDDTPFDLGPRCFVRVLKLPSKETHLFEGPKDRTRPVLGTRDVLVPC